MRKEIISFALSLLLVICGFAPASGTARRGSVLQLATDRLRLGETKSGSIPAPPAQPGCILGETQFIVEHPGGPLKLVIEARGNQNLDVYIRRDLRVTVEAGRIVADTSSFLDQGTERIILPESLRNFRNISFEPATYFVAIANCGPGAASYTLSARVIEPNQPHTLDLFDTVTTPATGLLIMGTAPAPQSDVCTLAETQFTIPLPARGACGSSLDLGIAVISDQNIKLFVRRGQRVAIEDGRVIADFSSQETGNFATVSIGNGSLSPGLYFIAIANCGTFVANYALLRSPIGIGDAFPPFIFRADFEKKDLHIFGGAFPLDAFVLINGEPQETVRVDDRLLIVRKARKKIARRESVILIVTTPSRCSSPPFVFTRR